MKKQIISFVFFIVILMAGVSISTAEVLYYNDFDQPGSVIYTLHGDTQVVDPVLDNQTKSLRFNCLGNLASFYYDSIGYFMAERSRADISFDIVTDGLLGTPNHFRVLLFVSNSVRYLSFNSDGTITVFNPGSEEPSEPNYWFFQLGTYTDLETIHVHMNFDIENDTWNVFINDQWVYSDFIDSEYPLTKVEFSLGAKESGYIDFESNVYIDNITIETGPFPIPGDIEGNDFDVDGADLAELIRDFSQADLSDAAYGFGSHYYSE